MFEEHFEESYSDYNEEQEITPDERINKDVGQRISVLNKRVQSQKQQIEEINDEEISIQIESRYTFETQKNIENTTIQIFRFNNQENCFEFNTQISVILQQSIGNVAFASLWGVKNSGKTYLINQITGMPIAPKLQTEGIWIYTKPIKAYRDDDTDIYLLDCQGWDNNLQLEMCYFIFAILLSSLFIFNLSDELQENQLSQLQHIKNIPIFVKASVQDNENMVLLSQFSPSIMFLERDFQKESEDLNLNLEKFIVSESKNENNRIIKNSILNFFKDREYLGIPPPNDQKFKQSLATLQTIISKKCHKKLLHGNNYNGSMMYSFIESLVNDLNENQCVINLEKTWEFIMRRETVQGLNLAIQTHKVNIQKHFQNREVSISFEDLFKILIQLRDNSLQLLFSIAGFRRKNPVFTKYKQHLKKYINEQEQQLFVINNKMSQEEQQEIIMQTSMKLYNRFNNDEYKVENIDEFIQDFSDFLNNYDVNAKSNQKSEVLCQYLSENHQNMMIGLIKFINDNYEKLTKMQQEENQKSNKEQQFQTELNALEKSLKLNENKIKQLEQDNQNIELEKENLLREVDLQTQLAKKQEIELSKNQKLVQQRDQKLQQKINLQREIDEYKRQQKKSGCFCC